MLHAQIVDALEALYADRLAEQVERLAHYALRGEVWDKALTYGRQAGEKAMTRSAYREAVGYFEQGLSALPHLPEQRHTREQAIDLRLVLRDALLPSGDYGRILACLHEAESLVTALDDPRRLGRILLGLSHYFFTMGAPLFLCYFLYSFHSRVQPNWIAPSVVPLFCLMALFWADKIKSGAAWVKSVLGAALIFGALGVAIVHNTDLTQKLFKIEWPARSDPLSRTRGWRDMARIVGEAREKILAEEKTSVFIIGNHYTTASAIAFYLPEANKSVRSDPFVYCMAEERPSNQYYFWLGYQMRKGQNAIFVREVSLKRENPKPPPKELFAQFKSVTNLGIFDVEHRKQVIRKIQIFVCRELQ